MPHPFCFVQVIWCPIVYGSYQIPMAVLTNGGKLSEVPAAVQEEKKKTL